MQDDPNEAEGQRRSEDKPFDPHLRLRDPESTLALLGLVRSDGRQGDAEEAMAANLIWLVRMEPAQWLFYSRDHNHYVGGRRYYPRFYRRQLMVAAVAMFVETGLVVEDRTRPSRGARFRSRFRPSASLVDRIRSLPFTVTTLVGQRRELIVLKDKENELKPYAETDATFALRTDVAAHNAFLGQFEITVRHPQADYDEAGFLVIGKQRFDPTRKNYYLVFNVSFDRGGRWYGPWWQLVPSAVRAGILIDGMATREIDIRACHMRLICAHAGIELGDADPYTGFDFPRAEIKHAINTLLNAANWQSAHGAIAGYLRPQYGAAAGARGTQIRTAIRQRYPALEPYWTRDLGLRLQNLDARLAARVQQRLRGLDVPCLSVHDSFIVPTAHADVAAAIIDEEFDWACLNFASRKIA